MPNLRTFLYSPSQEVKSFCLQCRSSTGDTNPPLPSPAIHMEGAKQFRAALVPAPGVLPSAFHRQFHHCCSAFWALNATLWWFNKLQISESGLQKPKLFLAQCLAHRFSCVSDHSYSFHPLFLLSCCQSMSDVTLQILLKSCYWHWTQRTGIHKHPPWNRKHSLQFLLIDDWRSQNNTENLLPSTLTAMVTVGTTRYTSSKCPDHTQSHSKSLQCVQRLQNMFYTFPSAQNLWSIRFKKRGK